MYTWASQLAQWHWLSSAGATGDMGSISGLGRSPEGNGNPLPYSCWENLMDRRAWRATVHGVARVRHNLVTKPPPPLHTLCCAGCHTHRGPQRDLTVLRAPTGPGTTQSILAWGWGGEQAAVGSRRGT